LRGGEGLPPELAGYSRESLCSKSTCKKRHERGGGGIVKFTGPEQSEERRAISRGKKKGAPGLVKPELKKREKG